MKIEVVLAIVLAVLLVISAVQAFELNSAKTKVSSLTISAGSNTGSSDSAQTQPVSGSSGGMVGGC